MLGLGSHHEAVARLGLSQKWAATLTGNRAVACVDYGGRRAGSVEIPSGVSKYKDFKADFYEEF